MAVPLEYGKENVDGYTMYLMDTIDVRGISLPSVPDTGEVSEGDNYTIGNNVTSDIAVRKALNYGINRTALAEGALNGLGVPCYDGIAHQLPWANPEAAIEDGDVAYANKTLEEAGWVDSDGDGIREKNGTKASFEVYYSASAPERQALALDHSKVEASGGALYILGNKSSISNVEISNASSKKDGSAVYVFGNNGNLEKVSISNSKSSSGDGTIMISGNNTLIDSCSVDSSYAKNAGALKIAGDGTKVSNSNFTNNNASAMAGAIENIS